MSLSQDGAVLEVDDPTLAQALREAGIVEDGVYARRFSPPALPTSTIALGRRSLVRLEDRATMAAAWLDMLTAYYGRSFNRLIRSAQRRELVGGQPADLQDLHAAMVRQALVFDQLSPWTPFQGACLFRCFMLLRLLRREGFNPLWVFGVRTWPFYAHCWLQSGDIALTDHAERLASFSPIFAV